MFQGSCMINTIRNLLYILCRNTSSSVITTKNMREDIRDAFVTSIYEVPGTTSFATLKEFSNKILSGVSVRYQPTLELFICTINSLLRMDLRESIVMPTPQQYIVGLLGIDQNLISKILRKITDHNNISVTINENPIKLSSDWPQCCLTISDEVVNKKITIAFGKRGTGEHIEITNITTYQ